MCTTFGLKLIMFNRLVSVEMFSSRTKRCWPSISSLAIDWTYAGLEAVRTSFFDEDSLTSGFDTVPEDRMELDITHFSVVGWV